MGYAQAISGVNFLSSLMNQLMADLHGGYTSQHSHDSTVQS
jgi:hypothetical protein